MSLDSLVVVIIGILGGHFFSVFVQDVNEGAFAAGATLSTGVPEVIVSCVKAASFLVNVMVTPIGIRTAH